MLYPFEHDSEVSMAQPYPQARTQGPKPISFEVVDLLARRVAEAEAMSYVANSVRLPGLVNIQKANWKMAIYSGFSHEKW